MPKNSKIHRTNRRSRRRNIKNSFPFDSMRIRLPHEEVKLFPQSGQTAYFNAAAGQVIVDVTAVTQGNSGAQRVGDVLSLTGIHFRAVINNGQGVTAPIRNITRILFFQYLGDCSVAGKPTIADFFQTSTSNIGNTYGSFSTFDIDYARQYRVLWDSGLVLTVGSSQVAVTGVPPIGVFKEFDLHVPLRNAQRDIAFYTGLNTGPNHIFLLVTGDQQTIATNPSISYSLECRFTDA